MITGISFVSVWVLDQDAAKEFYNTQLGCEVTNGMQLENGIRWLTVRPQGSTGQELLLMDPAHSMLDEETAQQVRGLIAKGALSPGVMATTDCRGDHALLSARGVEFAQPPAERPTGLRPCSGITPATGTASPSVGTEVACGEGSRPVRIAGALPWQLQERTMATVSSSGSAPSLGAAPQLSLD